MYKRVEKRRRKQEKEEELGLTEEMKEVLGMHDTDSDESNSSDSDTESGDEDEDEGPDVVQVPQKVAGGSGLNKRVREEDDEDESETASGGEEEGESESESEDDGEEGSDDDEEAEEEEATSEHLAEGPQISITEAMLNPIYTSPTHPDQKQCAVCPGKLLKHDRMAEVHCASKVSGCLTPTLLYQFTDATLFLSLYFGSGHFLRDRLMTAGSLASSSLRVQQTQIRISKNSGTSSTNPMAPARRQKAQTLRRIRRRCPSGLSDAYVERLFLKTIFSSPTQLTDHAETKTRENKSDTGESETAQSRSVQ